MIWDKIKNYVYGSIAIILLVSTLGLYISNEHYKNQSDVLTEQVTLLKRSLDSANGTIDSMNKSAENVNKVSVKRQEDRQQINNTSVKKQEQLNESIKTNPDWSNSVVPDGVRQSLQTE